MNNTNKKENIEKDTLELVLEEFSEEQKMCGKTLADLVTAINGLTDKISSFEEKLNNPKAAKVFVDTTPMQEIVKKGVTDMLLTIGTRPKPITRKFQLLLFPEQDAKLFYKIVFGRWFLMLVIMFFLTNVYKFCIHWSDNQKEEQLLDFENDRIKKAWSQLYSIQNKLGKRLMDSTYIRTK